MNDAGAGETISTGRGQTALIGFVILIGMVAVASAGILVVGGELLTTTEHQTEEERVLQAFTELSQNMQTVSANDDVSKSIDLDAGEHGAVVKTNTSTLHVSGGDVDETIHIGAIEYEGEDGTRIAYQSGAVFHETGEETQIVSSPPVYFDADAESLSFPIIKAKDDADLSSGDVTVRHAKTDPLTEANLVENDTVTIQITSEYYRGWETYFEQQGPTSVQEVESYENNESGTVTAEFGYLDPDIAFEDGMVLSDGVKEHSNGTSGVNYDEDEYKSGSVHELDEVIDEMVADEEVNNKTNWTDEESLVMDGTEDFSDDVDYIDEEGVFPNGTYYAEEIDLGDVSFNLTEGNVTLVVNGDIQIEDGMKVEGWDQEEDRTLKIYSTGNLNIDGADVCAEPCEEVNAKQLQIFGTSDMHVSIGPGTSTVNALLYAASDEEITDNEVHGRQCDAQVCLHSGDVYFNGSIVASSVGGNGNSNVSHDPKLIDEEIEIYPDDYPLPPQITYLNIAEHQVEIEEN
ncbi:hypothetical protein CV102_16780 [Natronococcus pandeyae]|uniref:DUF7305 domain-containing protein n=1 Tax=Natronococcus pandeyae TaxID=2055836 RepID=A0A8J8Q2A5_9EURY|nr:hypothetical protein [Natronococcus pandeyae]TYL37609.1 hypothetical protein CV102_16780 [Natronococcus pandeyae]